MNLSICKVAELEISLCKNKFKFKKVIDPHEKRNAFVRFVALKGLKTIFYNLVGGWSTSIKLIKIWIDPKGKKDPLKTVWNKWGGERERECFFSNIGVCLPF